MPPSTHQYQFHHCSTISCFHLPISTSSIIVTLVHTSIYLSISTSSIIVTLVHTSIYLSISTSSIIVTLVHTSIYLSISTSSIIVTLFHASIYLSQVFFLIHSHLCVCFLSPFLTRCQGRLDRASPRWHGQGQWSWGAPAPARSGHAWRSGQSHRQRRSASWSQFLHTGPANISTSARSSGNATKYGGDMLPKYSQAAFPQEHWDGPL